MFALWKGMSGSSDPAAVFACALSLWRECMRRSRGGRRVNFSECYNGGDEFMRVLMRVGTRFEDWACENVAFDGCDEVWPYLLEERFGSTCTEILDVTTLDQFDDNDCLHVAMKLSLPIKLREGLRVPVDVSAENPVSASAFRNLRIMTVRIGYERDEVESFTFDDDPFDEEYDTPVYALYGVLDDGMREHIADYKSYEAAAQLAHRIAPGILLPDFLPFSKPPGRPRH